MIDCLNCRYKYDSIKKNYTIYPYKNEFEIIIKNNKSINFDIYAENKNIKIKGYLTIKKRYENNKKIINIDTNSDIKI